MTRLYPLSFHPIYRTKIWGNERFRTVLHKDTGNLKKTGESWEISGWTDDISVVKNGFLAGNDLQELIEIYMGDLVGDHIYEKYGVEFPILVKFIDADDILSVQVHPDDVLARERHNAYGKAEMWYVMECDPGAEIIVGFNRDVSREEYMKHLREKSLREILNSEKTSRGDVFYLPPGRIHAIGAGVLVAEISQTSDITYRIYDWDRVDANGKGRELHTDLALDAIDYKAYPQYKTPYTDRLNETTGLVSAEHFSTNLLHFDQPLTKDYFDLDSFVIYIGLDGESVIEHENGTETIRKGETILLPAVLKDIRLVPSEECRLLEVYIK
jgi:mannose-6-phosphate isomerase